jgi:hypothetical protein
MKFYDLTIQIEWNDCTSLLDFTMLKVKILHHRASDPIQNHDSDNFDQTHSDSPTIE